MPLLLKVQTLEKETQMGKQTFTLISGDSHNKLLNTQYYMSKQHRYPYFWKFTHKYRS
jgi:hypothetical protein